MSLRHRIAAVMIAFLLGATPATPAGVQGSPQTVSGLTTRTTVHEVGLDLVVRDGRGRQVKDLKSGDVNIYEDGVRQEIRSFRLVSGREIRQRGATEWKTEVSGGGRPRGALNLICIVFHNILPDATTVQYTLQNVRQFFGYPLRPGTYVGVFRLDERLVVLHPFTDDRAALSRAAANGFSARPIDFARAADAIPDARPAGAPKSASLSPDQQPAAVRQTRGGIVGTLAAVGGAAGESGEAQHIDQVKAMVDQLSGLAGTKTVLLFTTGMVKSRNLRRLDTVVAKANQAQIRFYAFTVGGQALGGRAVSLGSLAATSAGQGQINQSLSEMAEKSRQMDDVLTVAGNDTLRALSENTGGDLFYANTLEKPFQRVLEDADTHYEVTYRPASQKLDGRWRSIAVKLSRPSLNVQTRSGYFALPDVGDSATLASFEIPPLQALTTDPPPHAFDFRCSALRFRSDDTGTQYAITFEVSAAKLVGTPEPGRNSHRFHVSLLALMKDSDGQVVGKMGKDLPVEIPNDQLAAARAGMLTHTHLLRLTPGRYTLEAAAVDLEGRQSSTSVMQMEVPGPRNGVRLSSIVLVQRLEPAGAQVDGSDPLVFRSRRVVPLLATTLPGETKPYVYFVVYPDTSNLEKPRLQVEFFVGGQLLARKAVDLPSVDARGAIPMVAAAATHTGDCELRITAVQGNDATTASVKYNIAAK